MKNAYATIPVSTPPIVLEQGDIVTMGSRAIDPTEPFIVAKTKSDTYQLISLVDGNRWDDKAMALEQLAKIVYSVVPKGTKITLAIGTVNA